MKLLIALTIILLTPLLSISQTNSATDSCTCIPNYQLRQAAKRLEQGKILSEEFSLFKMSYKFLEMRLALKDSIIKANDSLNKNNLKTIDVMNQQIAVLKLKETLLKESADEYKKEAKKIRRKFILWGSVTVASSAAIIFLIK